MNLLIQKLTNINSKTNVPEKAAAVLSDENLNLRNQYFCEIPKKFVETPLYRYKFFDYNLSKRKRHSKAKCSQTSNNQSREFLKLYLKNAVISSRKRSLLENMITRFDRIVNNQCNQIIYRNIKSQRNSI